MTTVKIISVTLSGVLLLSGCSSKKVPLLPPMTPVKLDSKSVSNMKKEDIQWLLSKTMNEKVAAAGGSAYLNDPTRVAISTTGVREGTHDDRYVLWQKYSYSYSYGYYYDSEKNEVLEVPVSACISSYLSGTSGKVHIDNDDCEEYSRIYHPREDYKNKVLAFRAYLSSEFPSFIADYNSKKSK